MKIELLKYMLLEKIRLNSELRGTKSFLVFPLIILIGTAITCYAMLNYSDIIGSSIVQICLILFFTFGLISGTFGLNASNYLERRFGDYGRLFTNALVLPIKLSTIFMMDALTDSIFYLGWFILPLFGGGTLALLLSGLNAIPMIGLLTASIIAFLLGMSISFLLTVIITKSTIIFLALLTIISITAIPGFKFQGMSFFPPFYLYKHMGFLSLALNIILIMILFFITSKVIGSEYNVIKKKEKYKSFKFGKINHFLFKDMIDLNRTHGIFAKPLFNVAIPSILLLALLSSLNILNGGLSIITGNLIFVAILLGTLSVNFFNVILSGDSFAYYIFLPASLKDFIAPKIILTQVICSVQGVILILAYSFINSTTELLLASIIVLIPFIYYTVGINFFINGLKPNENSMNVVSLGWMTILFLPMLIVGMTIPILTTSLIVHIGFSAIITILGFVFYKLGIRKWSKRLE